MRFRVDYLGLYIQTNSPHLACMHYSTSVYKHRNQEKLPHVLVAVNSSYKNSKFISHIINRDMD